MVRKKFSVIAGDKRSVELAYLLMEDGYEVKMYGFDKLDIYLNVKDKLHEAILDSQVIIGPLPFTEDEESINSPFSSDKIFLDDILKLLSPKHIFTAGRIPISFQEKASLKNLISVDYFKREEMQVLNAVPTAEGAVQIAMEEMDITLHGSNSMVLGYGRIGETLAKTLKGIGANVYVTARKPEDLAWIKNNGLNPVPLSELQYYLSKMDVIFNTIPEVVLHEDLLARIQKNTIFIETASKPGGIDISAAEDLGIKIVPAQGLPGKVAPVTAARVIKDTIYNIIGEIEEK